jgi:hypothetical protein
MIVNLPVRQVSEGRGRGPTKQNINSDLRELWQAELKACDKRRTSLIRQMKRAARSGDRRKIADLDKKYWATFPPTFRPRTNPATPWSPEQRYVCLDSKTYGSVDGLMTDGEWDKTIPRRLRNEKGRRAWDTVARWQAVSEQEKRNIQERILKVRNVTSYMVFEFLRRLDRDDGEFFSKIEIALAEKRRIGFEKLKAELIAYRFSLNFSRTPGQPRHTIAEIKQIVAPNSAITPGVFRNMIREFEVPHLAAKRGKGSPSYPLTGGAH